MSENLIPFQEALDQWLSTLDVEVVMLTECLVSDGFGLSFPGAELPGLHFILDGGGFMTIDGLPKFNLVPNMMIITPPGKDYRFEASRTGQAAISKQMEKPFCNLQPSDTLQRCVSDGKKPVINLICGHFQARNAASENLFSTLKEPIFEQFDPADQLGARLKVAVRELSQAMVGSKAMATAILQQVLVTLFRRAMISSNGWLSQMGIVTDLQISRAFSEMLAHPGGPHSLASLAQTASLSRSAFIERFNRAFGCAPMAMLRELRLLRANELLRSKKPSIDQVALEVGYLSRSSFSRAFRQRFGSDPSATRNAS